MRTFQNSVIKTCSLLVKPHSCHLGGVFVCLNDWPRGEIGRPVFLYDLPLIPTPAPLRAKLPWGWEWIEVDEIGGAKLDQAASYEAECSGF